MTAAKAKNPKSQKAKSRSPRRFLHSVGRWCGWGFSFSAFQLFSFFLIGCGSTGSDNPAAPHNGPETFRITYCRVVDNGSDMHVQWSASRPTSGDFRYGGTNFNHLVRDTVRADSHDVALTGLRDSTQYIFELTVRDSVNDSLTSIGTFTTPVFVIAPLQISGLTITEITESSARIRWQTNIAANTVLYYGRTLLADSLVNDSLVLHHDVLLSGLNPSSTYHVRPESADSTHQRGIGADTLFATVIQMLVGFPDTTVALGDSLRLPIFVEDAEDLAAMHIGLSFTPGSIEVLSIEEGPFYSQHDGFIFFSDIHNSGGQAFGDLTWNILYADSQRAGTDADGAGVVAFVKLRALSAGDAHFSFVRDSSFALDAFAVQRRFGLQTGSVQVTP
ncbi:MAG TPA: hypothetical protein VGL38_07205 [bacterium]|jgi:hypothetical protein